MQRESEIEGRMIEETRLVGLLVVLDAAEIAQVVGVAVGFEVGRVGVEHGLGTGIKRTGVVVAIELESPSAGPMEVVHCETVVASALSVAVPVLMAAARYRHTDRTLSPEMVVVVQGCLWILGAEETLPLRLMLSASLA